VTRATDARAISKAILTAARRAVMLSARREDVRFVQGRCGETANVPR
jgi:hypothetical protein